MNTKKKTLTHRIPVRLHESYWKGAQRAARAMEITPTAVIRIALREFLLRCAVEVSDDV